MSVHPPINRQRLPFFGLLLAAVAGILIADFTDWPSLGFLIPAILLAMAGVVLVRGPWIFLSVACAFACVHVWQTRESPSQRLADSVGDEKILAMAKGRVVTDPVPYGAMHERFTLAVEEIGWEGRTLFPSARVAVIAPIPAPAQGDLVSLTGSLQEIAGPRNPGEFDARAWMARSGIFNQIEVAAAEDMSILRKASGYSLIRLANRSREWMEKTLRLGISEDPVVCDFLAGMVLGVTASIPDSLQQEFRNTGTFHLFSVSGLHVGMIALILWQALKMAGVSRPWAVALIIPSLFFYALLTGWKPSSLRSATMSAIFLIGLTASQRPVPINSLGAAAFFILVQWTNEIFNPGFQLSFLVVAAILLLALPLHDGIRRHVHPDPFVPRRLWTWCQKQSAGLVEGLGGLVAVSVAAWIGSLPLTLYYFHLISFSALPANLLVVPLAFLIMVTAVLALFGGIFSVTVAAIFNNANWLFSQILLWVIHLMSCLPYSFVYVGRPAPAPVVVTVFDFGAGGGAAIESDGAIWLLDCGPKWQLDRVILPWLRSRGKSAPEGLILTHGDARHIGAAEELITDNRPGIIVESMLDDRSSQRQRIKQTMEELGIPKSLHRAGDLLRLSDSATLKILYPPTGILRNVADDKALVVKLDAGSASILFLSDTGESVWEWLRANAAPELSADVIVKGTPRSGIPLDLEFIDAVKPTLIISTAAHFPESERMDVAWLEHVGKRGIRVFRQDVTGAVRIEIQPSGFQASGFYNGEQFPESE
ncbi:MAG: ComEC/Rec2 family competence protein [Chthoniobacterales bacterium]|nr:ComEC/Rec2 family competence protein [Chthoniobacterales bacterium]